MIGRDTENKSEKSNLPHVSIKPKIVGHFGTGQFGTGQFGTKIIKTDNLAPDNLAPGQFGSNIIKRTIWHQEKKMTFKLYFTI